MYTAVLSAYRRIVTDTPLLTDWLSDFHLLEREKTHVVHNNLQ